MGCDFERFVVASNELGKRLDVLICEKFSGFSRNFVQKLFLNDRVFVNGKLSNKHRKARLYDEVLISFPEPEKFDVVAQNIKLDVVYEDDYVLVVNKPKGMVVHPAPGHFEQTLVNALMWHCKNCLSSVGGVLRPGIVHRIDKDTSGLLLVAKTDEAHVSLAEQIKNHSIGRVYEAIVHGNFKKSSGVLNFPIGRSRTDRKKMAVCKKTGKQAITHFEVIKQFKNFSYLKLKLETGRTHQIRVHLAYVGHPVAGDEVYGPKNGVSLGGQCLHAKKLSFFHFKLGERLVFSCEPDETFKKFLNCCERMG